MMAKTAAEIVFNGRMQQVGDRTIVRLPEDASTALPSRGQVAVTGTIDGHPVETVLEPDGMRGHWLSVDGGLAQDLSAEHGETVTVELRMAEAWPEPEIPEDLRTALDDAPEISESWTDITSMARWEWVRWVNATKNPATRQRRIEVSVSKLRDGKRRPC